MGIALLYVGSAIITLWGIAHIVPTKSVVRDFGGISQQNARIIRMTWVSEGLSLCFIGILVHWVTVQGANVNPVAIFVERAAAVMLLVSAVWSGMTGARTPIVPMKMCPVVKTVVAVLFFVGSM